MPPPIPPSFEHLTPEQQQEALAAAEAAKRAEERAEQRALERALREKEAQRRLEDSKPSARSELVAMNIAASQPRVQYVPKKRRQLGESQEVSNGENASTQATATQQPQSQTNSVDTKKSQNGHNHSAFNGSKQGSNMVGDSPLWTAKEKAAARQTYGGSSNAADISASTSAVAEPNKKRRPVGSSGMAKTTFKFQWDDHEDTMPDADDLLYRGVSARSNGSSMRDTKNQARKKRTGDDMDADADTRYGGNNGRGKNNKRAASQLSHSAIETKPLHLMTPRDWRILRENWQIQVKGGRAPPPLRSFDESSDPDQVPPLHPALLDAIHNVLRYKQPSPIQRQAIPMGLLRRDMIGIAETGSGKTIAFGAPLCQYLLQLPPAILDRVADDGPLAIVLAPTRELALQIDGEFRKLLSRQNIISTCSVVGGQSIQQQAQALRQGVHIVVGTPGRINECLDMAYMVLNQCSYVVLDEADRMIDMGFAPQLESILDAMGGSLKSEKEEEAYRQEKEDLQIVNQSVPRHRLTAMFSATMPPEVERLAQRYLRHPAIVSVGDQDTRKNARIEQRIIFLGSPHQKEQALIQQLQMPQFRHEKVIVFVNEKKHADGVGRIVERSGRSCVVLHGGKSQEQREENLEAFRKGGVVLVATDVAGRGLDITDVAHVINFDLPTRSIESYTHRIGRTGRAGKTGLATSFITDQDEGIMAPLKAYLESTGNAVPDRLARHPAASAVGDHGNLIY
jgi:ATP-dependent RNA helicase DDX23/PRP28